MCFLQYWGANLFYRVIHKIIIIRCFGRINWNHKWGHDNGDINEILNLFHYKVWLLPLSNASFLAFPCHVNLVFLLSSILILQKLFPCKKWLNFYFSYQWMISIPQTLKISFSFLKSHPFTIVLVDFIYYWSDKFLEKSPDFIRGSIFFLSFKLDITLTTLWKKESGCK